MAKVTESRTDSPVHREQRGREIRTNVLVALVLLGGISLHSGTAFGWAGPGHMQVAAVAFDQLKPAVKTKVAALLRENPNYNDWVKSASKKDAPKIAFITAATWPDYIKTQHNTYTDDGDHSSGAPESKQNIGYPDHLMHKYWHYIDIPFSPDGTATQPEDPVNAKVEIATFHAALASKDKKVTKAIKSYDLVWLLHLVGDVHQPLHCTSRFDKVDPHGDSGGNNVKVCEAQNCGEKLHAVWDDFPGKTATPAEAIAAASVLKPADPKLVAIQDEGAWVQESFEEAKADVYVTPIGVGSQAFALTPDYLQKGKALADERVALAGARLAGLLNAALKL